MTLPLPTPGCGSAGAGQGNESPTGRNFSAGQGVLSDQAPDLEVILLLLSVADSGNENVWNSKDESEFWLWLVRCRDSELDSFINDFHGPGPYLDHAQAERQYRQREQCGGFRRWRLFAWLTEFGSAFARWARNPYCSNAPRTNAPLGRRPQPGLGHPSHE